MVRKKKKKVPATRQRSIFTRREVNKYYDDLSRLIDLLRDFARSEKIREGIAKEEIDTRAWKKFGALYGNNVWKLMGHLDKKEKEIKKQIKKVNKFGEEVGLEAINFAMMENVIDCKKRRNSYQSTIRLAKEAIRKDRTIVSNDILSWNDLERQFQNEIFLEEVENEWKRQ